MSSAQSAMLPAHAEALVNHDGASPCPNLRACAFPKSHDSDSFPAGIGDPELKPAPSLINVNDVRAVLITKNDQRGISHAP
jgi:hypothetical protein